MWSDIASGLPTNPTGAGASAHGSRFRVGAPGLSRSFIILNVQSRLVRGLAVIGYRLHERDSWHTKRQSRSVLTEAPFSLCP